MLFHFLSKLIDLMSRPVGVGRHHVGGLVALYVPKSVSRTRFPSHTLCQSVLIPSGSVFHRSSAGHVS